MLGTDEQRFARIEVDRIRKEILKAEEDELEEILPEAFAAVREASKRTIGLRHYDVQLIGGMVLHSGTIAEMKTGEGKTLVATLPLYLNALTGRGVHLVTPNDYLSKVGLQLMGPIYHLLGVSAAVIQNSAGRPGQGQLPLRSRVPVGRRSLPGPAPHHTARRLPRRHHSTAPTTSSASTICATTWCTAWSSSPSASCTTPSSTRSTTSSSTRRAPR